MMPLACQFTITGNPQIKKNSRTIGRNAKTGRMFPMKSAKLRDAEDDAVTELQAQRFRGFKQYEHPIAVKFLFYRATHHKVDLSNLYEFAQDCLQRAGIIADDYLIESHDGSRRYFDAENPRTEIFISPFVEVDEIPMHECGHCHTCK